MTKQFLYLLFLGFMVLACQGKVIEEPIAPPKPEQEKPPCLTCNYDEESPIGCLTCANEQVSEIYTDVKAKVVVASHDKIKGNNGSLVFVIDKFSVADDSSYIETIDSLLIPCKKIPVGYDTISQRVKISGKLMSCKKLFSCPNCNGFFFGRKFILTQIR